VEPGDVAGLAEKISRLLRDKPLREAFGRASREKVFSEHLVADKVARLGAILQEMASGAA
jgi:glycosyltransferase involved in cell wall biosynthesis